MCKYCPATAAEYTVASAAAYLKIMYGDDKFAKIKYPEHIVDAIAILLGTQYKLEMARTERVH